jgi:hypothetical protein
MGLLTKVSKFFTQSDQERLHDEIREWASRVPGTQRIGGCPCRETIRVAGWVSRLRLRPMNGTTTLEAVVNDGTGEVTASWLGRASIPGLALGSGVILEGVVADERDGLRMVNPRFEFA